MTVFVDDVFIPFRGSKYCHMASDTSDEEVHTLAEKIGLKRRWFQADNDRPWYNHYDVSQAKRRQAIAQGAVEVTADQLIRNVVWKKRPKRTQPKETENA